MTTRDEILAMAREAGAVGFHNCTSSHHELFLMSAEAISELVRLAQAAAYERAAAQFLRCWNLPMPPEEIAESILELNYMYKEKP